MVCEQAFALVVNQARVSRLSWALPYLVPRRGLSPPVVVGKQGGECSFYGEHGAGACSLQTDMVIHYYCLGFFSTGTSVTRLFGSV